MKNTCSFRLYVLIGLIVLALMAPGVSLGDSKLAPQEDKKLRAEEIVTKHLESIAAAETRASVQSIIAGGKVVASYRSPVTAQFNGQGVIASEGNKSVIGMTFENTTYAQENLGFDGDTVTVSYARPGARSSLGDFILTHKDVLKNGIVGGTLSRAWALQKDDKKQKFELGGTKKIGNRSAYELKYFPRGGTDLRISLFFDTETFHHLRTEYNRTISAQMGATIDASGGQRTTRYQFIEDFSDFKKEGSLVLPHIYKITLELYTRGGTFSANWEWALTEFAYNQAIQPGTFKVSSGL